VGRWVGGLVDACVRARVHECLSPGAD
jgi:hypothetical protein